MATLSKNKTATELEQAMKDMAALLDKQIAKPEQPVGYTCHTCGAKTIPFGNGQTVCDECLKVKKLVNKEAYICACPTKDCQNEVAEEGVKCVSCANCSDSDGEAFKKWKAAIATPKKKKLSMGYPCANNSVCPWGNMVNNKYAVCGKCKAYYKTNGKFPAGFLGKKGKAPKPKKHTQPLEAKVWKRIGLHPKLNLKMECADFYLLEKMVAESGWTDSGVFMGNEKLLNLLSTREEFLAHEFSTYLDMALGGEIRHAYDHGEGSKYKGKRPFSDEMEKYLIEVGKKERDYAWDVWTRMRRKAPVKTLPLLEEAVKIFGGKWGRGAGGEMWAMIGRVALPFIKGSMSARSFVNLCWSLQHCNDLVFDKTYNINGLAKVLEIQAEGWYDRDTFYGSGSRLRRGSPLVDYASPEVQVLWKRFKKEQHKPQGMDVPEWHGTGD